jgi:arylesterase/paraoxonase
MKRKWIIVLLLCLTAGAVLVMARLNNAWHFRPIERSFSGVCATVSGVVGAEDITVNPRTGIAYISVCDRRSAAAGQDAAGGILAYDLNVPGRFPVRLDTGLSGDFQPHGICLFTAETGAVSLFVVNHGKGRHAVDIFDLDGLTLVHRKTVTGPLLFSPNDVAAVDEDRFYVTNDHGSRSDMGKTLEDYLNLKRSGVVYYDGQGFRSVAERIGYANGIALGPGGQFLYLCATTEGTVRVYQRDLISGALALQQTVECGTGVDNIEVDDTGALWIGAHPKPFDFVMHARSERYRSPSEVIKLTRGPAGNFSQQVVYLDDGSALSGSSVGAVYRNRLLIGSVFEPFFLDCRME